MAITIKPSYPIPDRSNQTINHSKDEDGVIDVAWADGVMSDGRAFRAEYWAQDGVSMLTFFLSRLGLEAMDQQEIKTLIVAEGMVTFRDEAPEYCEVRDFVDDAGQAMWSVNVVVGDEDGTFLDGSVPMFPYAREGLPNTVFNPAGSRLALK